MRNDAEAGTKAQRAEVKCRWKAGDRASEAEGRAGVTRRQEEDGASGSGREGREKEIAPCRPRGFLAEAFPWTIRTQILCDSHG